MLIPACAKPRLTRSVTSETSSSQPNRFVCATDDGLTSVYTTTSFAGEATFQVRGDEGDPAYINASGERVEVTIERIGAA